MLVSVVDQALDAFAVPAINGNSDAGGKRGQFPVFRHDGMNALRDAVGFFLLGFRQNQGEFIAAVASGGINGAAVHAQSIRNTADGATADEMAVCVVDFFQTVKVEKQQREGAAAAIRAFGFTFQNIEKTAVVRESRERIAYRKMTNLLEETCVVEQSATERDGIANDAEALRKHERGVQKTSGLRGGELGGEVKPSGGVDGAVEGGIIVCQAPAIPDEGNQQKDCREKLLRTGNEGQLVRRHFRGQFAHGNGDEVGEQDDCEESACDFPFRVARSRNEFFDDQGNDEKEREDQAAEPESHGRPVEFENRLGGDVEEQQAGSNKNGTRQQETGTQDEGNTVLRALKADEGDGGKDKRQKPGDNLQIALQGGVGV